MVGFRHPKFGATQAEQFTLINLLTNMGSLLETMSFGIPCNLQLIFANNSATLVTVK